MPSTSLLKVLAMLMVLLLTRLLMFNNQTGIDSMNKTNFKTALFTCIDDTFWTIGCSGVAKTLPT
ncbi:hypothetical protein [Clostridium sp. CTA-1]